MPFSALVEKGGAKPAPLGLPDVTAALPPAPLGLPSVTATLPTAPPGLPSVIDGLCRPRQNTYSPELRTKN